MIRAGMQDWWFCRNRQCEAENRMPPMGGPGWARAFLERWQQDWLKSPEMRRVLAESGRGWAVDRMPQDQVVEQVAMLLERGEVHIHASTARAYYGGGGGKGSDDRPSPPPPFMPSSRAASAPAAAEDPATFSGALDNGAQIAALQNAAMQGAPFCPE